MFGIIGYSLLSNNFKFIKFGLSEYAEEPRFGSFNLYNSEVLRYFFEDIFLRTPHTTHTHYTPLALMRLLLDMLLLLTI